MKQTVQDLLRPADIRINGTRRWDIVVHDERFFRRVIADGSLGLGESYVDGWWDCAAIDEMMYRLLHHKVDRNVKVNLRLSLHYLRGKMMNLQSKRRAFQVGEKHYDIGNDLYQHMLDKRMTYTCGYWKQAKTLDKAQEAKLDLVCKKLKLKPGQKILDIGCGWGSFMKYAAKKYKVSCVGVTISKEQVKLGRQLCKGLPIVFRLQDYRDVNEKFDHIVSLGMIEHVGPKNYDTYMDVVQRCLKDNGLFLLHTIGNVRETFTSERWIEKYIFPNGYIPSAAHIIDATKERFVIEDWHNFGAYYDPTLMAWYKNFNKNWKTLGRIYDERFKRMWNYYLLICAASFRARRIHLWQIVFSKNGVLGGYDSVR